MSVGGQEEGGTVSGGGEAAREMGEDSVSGLEALDKLAGGALRAQAQSVTHNCGSGNKSVSQRRAAHSGQ